MAAQAASVNFDLHHLDIFEASLVTDRSNSFNAWAELQDPYVLRWMPLIRKSKTSSDSNEANKRNTNTILLLFRGQL
ncbi:hypothetical protein TYRP_010540 [Tyrophagus putrescentiae]|nr:hypothetical protein TYRP_010540 [Tyrophagus putrescentiae]